MKSFLRNSLRKLGYDIITYPPFMLKKKYRFLKDLEIELMLDIGANQGQYAEQLLSFGYNRRIISFEPTEGAFKKLQQKAGLYKLWDVYKLALGDFCGKTKINVSENSLSSSILKPNKYFLSSTPEANIIEQEEIEVVTLDTFFESLTDFHGNTFLKIDAQGFENRILNGAGETLLKLKGLQIELSINPLYEEEVSFNEILERLFRMGFKLFYIENGYKNPLTNEILQIEVYMFK